MTQQTSVEAYVHIKQSGMLSELQQRVLGILRQYGSMTQGEMWQTHFPTHQRHDVAPRFAELARFGLIEATDTRPCRVTGRRCLAWDVKGRVSNPVVRTNRNARIKELEAQVELLTSELRDAREARHG